MTKTQVQRNREHIARIRRKAHAFDKLTTELKTLITEIPFGTYAEAQLEQIVERAERQAGE